MDPALLTDLLTQESRGIDIRYYGWHALLHLDQIQTTYTHTTDLNKTKSTQGLDHCG